MRTLVRRQIEEAVNEEWPAMASQHASLSVVPASLAEALQFALALTPHSEGQKVAQREIVGALETALDARRQRIIVSESRITWAKWTSVVLLGALTLLAIAFVHSENRATTAIAMGIFASAVAVCLVMLASQDRPFAGPSPSSRTPWCRSCRRHGKANRAWSCRAASRRDRRRGGRHAFTYEQLSDEAVDCAAEASASADCVTLLTASEAESESGTAFTADSKLFQALSRSPGSASWRAW